MSSPTAIVSHTKQIINNLVMVLVAIGWLLVDQYLAVSLT